MTSSTLPTLLVLDIGTSSTRALLFDERARVVRDGIAQIENRPTVGPAGDVTFDADALFAAVVAAIDQVTAQTQAPVRAVAICTFVTNIVGLDTHDRPLTPVFTYAAPDCAEAAADLRRTLGEASLGAVHDRTGCLLHTSYLPARFRWMAQHHPAWLQEARCWLSIGDYVLWRLTGEQCTSFSVASWTGLLNRHTLQWDEEWLTQLALAADTLPPLVDAAPCLQPLRAEWRERWPTLSEARWLPAIGDGAAANIGSGAVDGNHIALTVGTTGAMRVVVPTEQSRVPDGLWLYRLTAQEALLGGATTEGGNLLAWLRATLRLPPLTEIEQMMADRAPAAHGLRILPFIAGERAPGWHDNAQAALLAFTQLTTPLDIYQAALEAIAYRFALIDRRLAPHLPDSGAHSTVVASGGALTGSPAWQQIVADVLGRPLMALHETELSARGAAVLTLRALGEIASLAALPPATATIVEPDARRHARHQTAIAEQSTLYQQLVV